MCWPLGHVSTSEGTSALATEAAKRAIADAGISPEEIEIVIVATSSPDRAFPSAAADVQGAIGAKHAVAFDITAACSGFIYALHIVQGFIQAGIYKTAVPASCLAMERAQRLSGRTRRVW